MKLSNNMLLALPFLLINTSALAVDINAEDLVNLNIGSDGVYEVTHSQLTDFGLDISGEPLTRVALMNRGEAVQLQLVGSTADASKFGPGASLRFVAESLSTIYTDTNVYTLRLDSDQHREIVPHAVPLAQRVPYAVSYLASKSYAPQTAYTFASPDKADPYYASRILALRKAATETVSLVLDDMVPGGNTGAIKPEIIVKVWGATDLNGTLDDHHVRVSLNGLQVLDETFDGFSEKKMQTTLSNVRVGMNSVRLDLPLDQGYDYEALNLNSVEIKYPRAFVAQDDSLSFTSSGNKFAIKGFNSQQIDVYRTAPDGRDVAQLVSAEAGGNCNQDTPRCAVRFSSGSGVANYYVVTPNSVKQVDLSYLPPSEDITSNGAQYLIITHPDFLPEVGEDDLLGDLAQSLQNDSGFASVDVVDVEQIYAQFGDHIFDSQAIRDYIKYAYENRGTQVVLMVGGDVYDYKGFENKDARSFIPSIYVATGDLINFAPVDAKYVDFDDNDIPDLPIGRLPVRNMSELNVLINKRSAYMNRSYTKQALFAADRFDNLGQYSFKLDALSVQSDFFDGWSVDTAFIDDMSAGEARREVVNSINKGVSLTSFFGHSSTAQWTFEGMFNGHDAARLNNIDKPTIVTQWGCWNTNYVNPNEDSMGHRFMMEGNRGAVAVMGATTLTSATNEKILSRMVFDRLAQGRTLGQALTEAKAEFGESHGTALDVLLGVTLLGFPELRL
jgi:hypothetical protein